LRARVDYQSLEQQLIAAQDSLEKDKLALARAIGLPLAQSFNLTDTAPYAHFDQLDASALIQQAKANRKDLAALVKKPPPPPISAKRQPPRVSPPSRPTPTTATSAPRWPTRTAPSMRIRSAQRAGL
jgi:hypothetical protein